MELSVIIVNYNVRFFLEQCLHSVEKAIDGINAEVFVVDNQSVDGSCAMVHESFPWVKLIENHENVGFSKANNQAIRQAAGKYILLLNPDTVVEEDCFSKVISFADAHPKAGGIGVKMIDGKGRFLPESKRAFPTPAVSFFKIFGLSALFPHSRTFARYHLGHLDKDKNHEVEILAGAFMFLRKSVLDEIGLLDEQFFMYGEDIDLSYRILQAGYSNHYLADTTIIHYKGESTKKGSVNYVRIFYQAMVIFAKKHFSAKNAGIYIALINVAIYFRAFLAVMSRFLKQILPPIIDFLLIYTGFLLGLPYWEAFKFGNSAYPDVLRDFVVPVYSLIWIFSLIALQAYRRPYSLGKLFKGLSTGTVVILLIYSLLPEDFRFSRALILLGFAWGLVSTGIFRMLASAMHFPGFEINSSSIKRIVIVAYPEEAGRIQALINQTNLKMEIIGLVSPKDEGVSDSYLGSMHQLHPIVEINEINEIIFSGKDIDSRDIIEQMHQLSDLQVDFKIAPPGSISVIGSNSIDTAGELYLISNNSIAKPDNLHKKRLFDLLSSVGIMLFFPLLRLVYPRSASILSNAGSVFTGKFTWVGYYESNQVSINHLPGIKTGIVNPITPLSVKPLQTDVIEKSNLMYSKEYSMRNDWRILLSSITK